MGQHNKELGARARACKGFRLCLGMVGKHDDGRKLVIMIDEGGTDAAYAMELKLRATICVVNRSEFTPDTDIPATRGCFLALVREAYGSPGMHLARCTFGDNSGWWLWYDRDGDHVHQAGRGRTENEAHIVALEAAPPTWDNSSLAEVFEGEVAP